jgi:hypothetical protein
MILPFLMKSLGFILAVAGNVVVALLILTIAGLIIFLVFTFIMACISFYNEVIRG